MSRNFWGVQIVTSILVHVQAGFRPESDSGSHLLGVHILNLYRLTHCTFVTVPQAGTYVQCTDSVQCMTIIGVLPNLYTIEIFQVTIKLKVLLVTLLVPGPARLQF